MEARLQEEMTGSTAKYEKGRERVFRITQRLPDAAPAHRHRARQLLHRFDEADRGPAPDPALGQSAQDHRRENDRLHRRPPAHRRPLRSARPLRHSLPRIGRRLPRPGRRAALHAGAVPLRHHSRGRPSGHQRNRPVLEGQDLPRGAGGCVAARYRPSHLRPERPPAFEVHRERNLLVPFEPAVGA